MLWILAFGESAINSITHPGLSEPVNNSMKHPGLSEPESVFDKTLRESLRTEESLHEKCSSDIASGTSEPNALNTLRFHFSSSGGNLPAGIAMMDMVEEAGRMGIHTECHSKGFVGSACTFPASPANNAFRLPIVFFFCIRPLNLGRMEKPENYKCIRKIWICGTRRRQISTVGIYKNKGVKVSFTHERKENSIANDSPYINQGLR